MKMTASLLVVGDVITLNRHPYEINSIRRGVCADVLIVKSTRGKKEREVVVNRSELINIKIHSPQISGSEILNNSK